MSNKMKLLLLITVGTAIIRPKLFDILYSYRKGHIRLSNELIQRHMATKYVRTSVT